VNSHAYRKAQSIPRFESFDRISDTMIWNVVQEEHIPSLKVAAPAIKIALKDGP
jgi:hypothetical protein